MKRRYKDPYPTGNKPNLMTQSAEEIIQILDELQQSLDIYHLNFYIRMISRAQALEYHQLLAPSITQTIVDLTLSRINSGRFRGLINIQDLAHCLMLSAELPADGDRMQKIFNVAYLADAYALIWQNILNEDSIEVGKRQLKLAFTDLLEKLSGLQLTPTQRADISLCLDYFNMPHTLHLPAQALSPQTSAPSQLATVATAAEVDNDTDIEQNLVAESSPFSEPGTPNLTPAISTAPAPALPTAANTAAAPNRTVTPHRRTTFETIKDCLTSNDPEGLRQLFGQLGVNIQQNITISRLDTDTSQAAAEASNDGRPQQSSPSSSSSSSSASQLAQHGIFRHTNSALDSVIKRLSDYITDMQQPVNIETFKSQLKELDIETLKMIFIPFTKNQKNTETRKKLYDLIKSKDFTIFYQELNADVLKAFMDFLLNRGKVYSNSDVVKKMVTNIDTQLQTVPTEDRDQKTLLIDIATTICQRAIQHFEARKERGHHKKREMEMLLEKFTRTNPQPQRPMTP